MLKLWHMCVEHTRQQVEFETTVEPDSVHETESDSEVTNVDTIDEKEILPQESPQQQESIAYNRPRREIRKPACFANMVAYALPIVGDDIPTTYKEVVRSSNCESWKPAMNDEMRSLHKKAIGCKWVYAKKKGFPNREDVRHKVRLVVKGYAQMEGFDYSEVFSPVVKYSSILILLTLVAQFDFELVQLDMQIVFSHGSLEEEIYKTQPDDYRVAGKKLGFAD